VGQAWVMFAKEEPGGAAYRERECVRAHMRQLAVHGHELGAGERTHLAEAFGIDGLEEPAPRRLWRLAAEAVERRRERRHRLHLER
jgi:hypothetical protein